MQAWDKLLDDKQITQLYYYVTARADKVLPPDDRMKSDRKVAAGSRLKVGQNPNKRRRTRNSFSFK